MLIVDEMQKEEYIFTLSGTSQKYGAVFGPCMCHSERKMGYSELMEHPAEAICIAALEAKGIDWK